MDSDQLILGFEFGLSRPLGRMVRLCTVHERTSDFDSQRACIQIQKGTP